MPCRVNETDKTPFSTLSHKASLVEDFFGSGMHGIAFDAGLNLCHGGGLRIPHGFNQCTLCRAGLAFKKGAGHVAVVAGLLHAGEDINNDQLMRSQRAVATLMWVAGLTAASYDSMASSGSFFETSLVDDAT